jgi:hypothetical protein
MHLISKHITVSVHAISLFFSVHNPADYAGEHAHMELFTHVFMYQPPQDHVIAFEVRCTTLTSMAPGHRREVVNSSVHTRVMLSYQ